MTDLSWPPFTQWVRPEVNDRTFFSQNLELRIAEIAAEIRDVQLRQLFINCIMNTLDTTTTYSDIDGKHSTHIITGDIEAMWLRDSTLQVWPYLRFASEIPEIRDLFRGLIAWQSECIVLDPYANAFYDCPKYGIHRTDLTDMKPGVHERKWELDSLCFFLYLVIFYVKKTQDETFFTEGVFKAIAVVLETLKVEQREFERGPYRFDRETDNPIDTLSNDGLGPDSAYTGMINSAFRPSDDACTYPFHIPSNLLAAKVLKEIADVLQGQKKFELAENSRVLAAEITSGITQYGFLHHTTIGKMFSYEVDGFGNRNLMDDANIPNLLALPYLGIVDPNDSLYLSTRSFVLSSANRYYVTNGSRCGIGSPHTPVGYIWPMALISEAITTKDRTTWASCLELLIDSSAGMGLLHESFDPAKPTNFTRSWFAWCNSYFGDLVMYLYETDPDFLLTFEISR